MNEGTNRGGRELVIFVRSYCAKFAALTLGVLRGTPYGSIRWVPPLRDVVKINVDASFQLTQKKASSRVVIRDENRKFWVLVVGSLTSCSRCLRLKQLR